VTLTIFEFIIQINSSYLSGVLQPVGEFNITLSSLCIHSSHTYSIITASTQNLQIAAQPATVDLGHDDLVILCSVVSPSQLYSVFTIQLKKNNSGTLQNVASVRAVNGQDTVSWQDSTLQGRATVAGSVYSPAAAQLRFIIPRDNVQCPADFTGYKCSMVGFGTADVGLVSQETNQIFAYYRGMQII
jgi:hypothetical protein